MTAYRSLGGLTIPPYFGEHVLPTYATIIGIELAPNKPKTQPVVTWNGWHFYLMHKIKLEPDTTFMHLMRVGGALGLQLALQRRDFPAMPDPAAQAKEQQFKTRIFAMARDAGLESGQAVAAGGAGRGRGRGRGQAVAGGTAQGTAQTLVTPENTKLALGILNGVVKLANTEANQNNGW
jgi:hypothetical protein